MQLLDLPQSLALILQNASQTKTRQTICAKHSVIGDLANKGPDNALQSTDFHVINELHLKSILE